jgi:hypothetical protein
MDIRDQYHDPAYGVLYHLLQARPSVAAFVKTAELDPERVAALPDSAFAWPARRLFPIDTPENTVLSSLYREKTAAVPAEVDAELARAQDVYGVRPLIEQARKEAQTAEQVKTAAAETEAVYLLPQHHRLRVKTAADVKVAEKLLLEQYDKLSMEDRAEGFVNLVKVARDRNVALEPATHRMAGMTVCTTKVAADFIEARRMATKEPLFQQAYEKLASSFRGKGEFIQDRDELVAAADALARLDKEAGVDRLYDKKVPDAVRTVFNTDKLAEETIDLAGRSVTLSKLAALPETFWEDIVGKDMLRDITDGSGRIDRSKLGQVVPTLPRDLKVILRHQVP